MLSVDDGLEESYPIGRESESCLVVSDFCDPGQSTGVGSHFLLQGIFPNQGWNPGSCDFPHCRQILYQLSHQGSPVDREIVIKDASGMHLGITVVTAEKRVCMYVCV